MTTAWLLIEAEPPATLLALRSDRLGDWATSWLAGLPAEGH
jgi:hypothetical protein